MQSARDCNSAFIFELTLFRGNVYNLQHVQKGLHASAQHVHNMSRKVCMPVRALSAVWVMGLCFFVAVVGGLVGPQVVVWMLLPVVRGCV
jgi:hypothetical protein